MAEDYENQLLPPDNSDKELMKAMLLLDIQEHLQAKGKGDMMLPIGIVTEEMKQRICQARRQHNLLYECREIREEISYDRLEMEEELQKALHGEGVSQHGKMTESQVNAFRKIQDAVNGKSNDRLFF